MADSGRELNEQLSMWERANSSPDPQLTIDYLDKYPSGFYAELAEANLDVLLNLKGEKKISNKTNQSNPYSKGSIQGREFHTIGDTYAFEERDLLTKIIVRKFKRTITGLESNKVIFNNGVIITDLLGNEIKSGNSKFLTPTQFFPAIYQIGHRWSTEYWWERDNGEKVLQKEDLKIVDREKIENQAGTFNAFVIRSEGQDNAGRLFSRKQWIDPQTCKQAVRWEVFAKGRGRIHVAKEYELIHFSEKG